MKNKKGITLIALVIIIVVLIILAGVAINMTLGENGILNRAKLAKKDYKESEQKESNEIGQMSDIVDNSTTISARETNSPIKRFIPNVLSKASHSINVEATTSSDTTQVICYVFIVNGKLKETNTDGKCEVTDLNAGTEYSIISVAVDNEGNTRTADTLITKTMEEQVFTNEFLQSGQTYGNVSITTTGNLNDSAGLNVIGIGSYGGPLSNMMR